MDTSTVGFVISTPPRCPGILHFFMPSIEFANDAASVPPLPRAGRQTGKRVRDKGKSNGTAYYIPPVCVRSRRAVPSESSRLSPTAHQENRRAAASSKCIEISGNVFGVRDTPRYLMRRDDDNNYCFVPLRTAYHSRDDGPWTDALRRRNR